jgi:hypothetical protein
VLVLGSNVMMLYFSAQIAICILSQTHPFFGATLFCQHTKYLPSKCRHPNCRHKNVAITR